MVDHPLSDVGLTIKGYSNSTNIPSLLPAFETLSIDVVLPGLTSNLLDTAQLESMYFGCIVILI